MGYGWLWWAAVWSPVVLGLTTGYTPPAAQHLIPLYNTAGAAELAPRRAGLPGVGRADRCGEAALGAGAAGGGRGGHLCGAGGEGALGWGWGWGPGLKLLVTPLSNAVMQPWRAC